MATANSNINITNLDFDSIKSTLQTYLGNQSQFTDYNFNGSVISSVLDLLSYNTYYNSFYLNMVANEMFLDTALKRSSVISHAKLLNYTPRSSICPSAIVNITVTGGYNSNFSIPKYTVFQSEAINGTNYQFVTLDSFSVPAVSNIATFNSLKLYQGQPVSYTFNVDPVGNPSFIFKLPDGTIDLSTLNVVVYPNSQSTTFSVYNLATDYMSLDETSNVYWVQESLDGYYEIYFGDGILGSKLSASNIVIVEYLTTSTINANGAKSFTLMDKLQHYSSFSITTIQPATGGQAKESIDSIKFQAPKSFSAQNRAVSKEDYITAIQQNKFGYSFDSVNVWGGEENDPPIYGQIFVCMKPTGGYLLTDTQKQRLISDVIKPISVMTVRPIIIDPDYTYVKISVNVVYDQKLTVLTPAQLQTAISGLIQNFGNSTLNTFNSSFLSSELNSIILNADSSILTNEISIQLQKKFFPNTSTPTTYNLYFGAPLSKGILLTGVNSSPSFKVIDTSNLSTSIDGVFIEESPTLTVGISSIQIVNPGFGYQQTPTIQILGDGTGATAVANMTVNGAIKNIVVTNAGSGYTSAIIKIVPAANDTTGQMGSATVVLQGQYGSLRTSYYNDNQIKTILNDNAGTIDYLNGIVTLNSFNPVEINNPLGQFTVTTSPTSTIFSSTYNRIITLDPFDPNSITVNVIAKS